MFTMSVYYCRIIHVTENNDFFFPFNESAGYCVVNHLMVCGKYFYFQQA